MYYLLITILILIPDVEKKNTKPQAFNQERTPILFLSRFSEQYRSLFLYLDWFKSNYFSSTVKAFYRSLYYVNIKSNKRYGFYKSWSLAENSNLSFNPSLTTLVLLTWMQCYSIFSVSISTYIHLNITATFT